jgi:hypothetical protein
LSLIERNAGDCSGAGANARADCGRNQISRDLDALDLAADEGLVARRYHAASGADEFLFVNAVDGADLGFVVGGDMDLGVEGSCWTRCQLDPAGACPRAATDVQRQQKAETSRRIRVAEGTAGSAICNL